MATIEYRSIALSDYEAVRRFLAELGWERRVSDPARFARMMQRADRTVVALDEGRVVGFARALCDGVSNGYISIVLDRPALRVTHVFSASSPPRP
jgi:hypothetical protein